MDIFFEQLVKVRITAAQKVAIFAILLVAGLLCVVLFLYSMQFPILIFGIIAVFYGVKMLLELFSKEYEYILTNGTVDVDCIYAKKNRKRIVSFECSNILRFEKYNPAQKSVTGADEKFIFAEKENPNNVLLLVQKGSKKYEIVFAPNEKMLSAIKNAMPAALAREVF